MTDGWYWAHPGELLNLVPELLNRREGGEPRRAKAKQRARGARARFAKGEPASMDEEQGV